MARMWRNFLRGFVGGTIGSLLAAGWVWIDPPVHRDHPKSEVRESSTAPKTEALNTGEIVRVSENKSSSSKAPKA